MHSRLQPVQVDGPEHLLIRRSESGSEACSDDVEEGSSEFHARSLDPLQTQLICREDSETGHSEELARVLEAAAGGAGLGGEEAT